MFGPRGRHPSQPDTMKSSGPVERLLRALGRRDSSRATSRVGVPTSWAEAGQGWRWGRGPGHRPDPPPQPSPFALHPLITLPLWGGQGCGMQRRSSGLSRTWGLFWLFYHLPALAHTNPGGPGPLHQRPGIFHCRPFLGTILGTPRAGLRDQASSLSQDVWGKWGLGVVKEGREEARSQECLRHWGVAFTDIIYVCHLC